MPRVLILGSSGMAGHVMTLYLEGNTEFDVTNLSRGYRLNDRTVMMDIRDIDAFDSYLGNRDFDAVINCTGILNREAEEKKDEAVFINSYLPQFLAARYGAAGTKVIQISTDCVFSGKTGAYGESALRDGDSFYARSKSLGEIINNKDLTFRTSIIGPDLKPDGIGLFNWFMNSSGNIDGYTDVIWTGITTFELAKAAEAAILEGLTGLYHLVPDKSISKYDLLELLKSVFGRRDITINKYGGYCSNKSLVGTRRDFNYRVMPYADMLEDMKIWIKANRRLYPHYFREQKTDDREQREKVKKQIIENIDIESIEQRTEKEV